MTDKVIDTVEDFLLWFLVTLLCIGIGILIAWGIVSLCNYSSKEEIHTEVMYVNDHQYLLFYNKDGDVKYIEHSPDCDCYTVDYD